MRIGILVRWVNPTIAKTVEYLSAQGAVVDLIHPEEQTINLASLRIEHDLYVLKSGTEATLSMAGALHMIGAATLNPYLTALMLRNKIIVTRALQEAGIPTPETFVTPHPKDLAPFLEDGLLIIKPYRGSRGEGIRIVHNADELDQIHVDGPVMAQRYHKPDPDEADRKIYRIGDQIFGVKRIWPLRTYEDKFGEPFTVWPELRQIALRCGDVFGLDLYGLDVVISQGQPYVVDINKFGSFVGVPNGPSLLANYLYIAAQRVLRGDPLITIA
jgi:ribosomal protein S6--L-glutamate ligase